MVEGKKVRFFAQEHRIYAPHKEFGLEYPDKREVKK